MWLRSLPTNGTLLRQAEEAAQSLPPWIAKLCWQSHTLYTTGGLVFCSHCGHVASCFRKGALVGGCASSKLVAIPTGSQYRRDQLLRGTLAGTTLKEWPDGSSKESLKSVVRVTAASVVQMGTPDGSKKSPLEANTVDTEGIVLACDTTGPGGRAKVGRRLRRKTPADAA